MNVRSIEIAQRSDVSEAYLMGYWDGIHNAGRDSGFGQLLIGLVAGACMVAMWWVVFG